ncbi:putative reverse transcriptase domain-containing protein [Tanacetum coccineum]
MLATAIQKLVDDQVAKALVADHATRNNTNVAGGSGGSGGQGMAPPIREYTFAGFMKCDPTQYHGNEGAVKLCRWFKKTKSVFGISEYAEMRLAVANGKSWADIKKMMLEELCPSKEIQRLENELRGLKLRDTNIVAYTQRFNELALLCPEAVPSEKKNVELYIKGLPKNIKGETTSSKPVKVGKQQQPRRQGGAKAMTATQNDDVDQGGPALNYNRCGLCHFRQCPPKCNRCGKRGYRINDCRKRIVATGANMQPIKTCFECGDRNHTRNQCPNLTNQRVGNVTGRAYAIRDAKKGQGPNVVTELGAFDVIIRMDWLVERDVVIVFGKKVVHIPVKNKMLVVKGNSGVSRLKVISCIKARKYIERGCQLFLAQITEKKPTKRWLEDVHVIHDFPEVFPDDLSGLPPPRQVEFRIEVMPGAAPVTRAPYRLAPSEMKELSDQLKELSEKGFIRPSSSP